MPLCCRVDLTGSVERKLSAVSPRTAGDEQSRGAPPTLARSPKDKPLVQNPGTWAIAGSVPGGLALPTENTDFYRIRADLRN